MGAINHFSQLGGGACGGPCAPVDCTDRPSCTDCFVPFVNAAHTKTRYPRKAIISLSGIYFESAEWGLLGPAPDCSHCACLNVSVVATHVGPNNINNNLWGWHFGNPEAMGPFAFGGGDAGGSGDCVQGGLTENTPCPVTYPWPNADFSGWECIEGDGTPSVIYTWLAAVLVGQPDGIYLAIMDVFGDVARAKLPDFFPLAHNCPNSPSDAMVLPDTLITCQTVRPKLYPIEPGFWPGGACRYDAITATVLFTDWVERDFASPA
jgi:hypothetical protein